jgi:hypothetical protein
LTKLVILVFLEQALSQHLLDRVALISFSFQAELTLIFTGILPVDLVEQVLVGRLLMPQQVIATTQIRPQFLLTLHQESLSKTAVIFHREYQLELQHFTLTSKPTENSLLKSLI